MYFSHIEFWFFWTFLQESTHPRQVDFFACLLNFFFSQHSVLTPSLSVSLYDSSRFFFSLGIMSISAELNYLNKNPLWSSNKALVHKKKANLRAKTQNKSTNGSVLKEFPFSALTIFTAQRCSRHTREERDAGSRVCECVMFVGNMRSNSMCFLTRLAWKHLRPVFAH